MTEHRDWGDESPQECDWPAIPAVYAQQPWRPSDVSQCKEHVLIGNDPQCVRCRGVVDHDEARVGFALFLREKGIGCRS